jgi:hypothetical protein
MFDLKRPCENCPFKRGHGENFLLGRERVRQIVEATAFQCHKTLVFDYDEDGLETRSQGEHPQQCASLMALLQREGQPNQIMQVAQRLIGFNAGQIECKRGLRQHRRGHRSTHTRRR